MRKVGQGREHDKGANEFDFRTHTLRGRSFKIACDTRSSVLL